MFRKLDAFSNYMVFATYNRFIGTYSHHRLRKNCNDNNNVCIDVYIERE